MSEMSWQLRHPDYGLMRIDLEETKTREGWTGKYLDSKRSFFYLHGQRHYAQAQLHRYR